MNLKKILLGGAALAAAPFTGGLSLPLIGGVGGALGAGGAASLISGLTQKKTPAGTPTGTATTPGAGTGATDATAALTQTATDAGARSKQLGAAGDQSLQQVVDYYSKLLTGNADAIAQATQPERARVIDQYDTARDAIAKFSPRGGGTTSASAYSRIAEANELADVTGRARQGAAPALAQIGQAEQGLGLSAAQLQSSDLTTLIQKTLAERGLDLQSRGQNLATVSGLGETLGTILGMILTRKKAA